MNDIELRRAIIFGVGLLTACLIAAFCTGCASYSLERFDVQIPEDRGDYYRRQNAEVYHDRQAAPVQPFVPPVVPPVVPPDNGNNGNGQGGGNNGNGQGGGNNGNGQGNGGGNGTGNEGNGKGPK